jgi:hypothetical protein
MKLRLENETTLTASLEHEVVLSHCLLGFFSTAMLVQKFATKGVNPIYPSHIKKTPSVLMYIELKIVTVMRYFIFVYSTNCTY